MESVLIPRRLSASCRSSSAPDSFRDEHSPSSLISKNWTPMANDFSSWFTTLQGRSHRRSVVVCFYTL